jgi:DNA-binding NarL/FixJ family response regulator
VYVRRAARRASGFLLKDAHSEQRVDAIGVIARGDALLAPSVTRLLIDEVARRRLQIPQSSQINNRGSRR